MVNGISVQVPHDSWRLSALLQGSHVLLYTFSSEQSWKRGALINDRQDGNMVLVELAKHLRGSWCNLAWLPAHEAYMALRSSCHTQRCCRCTFHLKHVDQSCRGIGRLRLRAVFELLTRPAMLSVTSRKSVGHG